MPIVVISDFEFDTNQVIGRGSYGVVCKGRRRDDHGQPVAVKRMQRHVLRDREVRILQGLSQIRHRNTVRLFGCMRSQEYVYVVMEYCNGGSLADYLKANNDCLPVSAIRIFLRQIADGMKFLVLRGICHRDLKPQNLLLSHDAPQNYPDPEDITLKIADFGVARFIEPGMNAMTWCGPPLYMAPEVLLGQPYDHRSDLWGIGTIVYQCLTGRMPFTVKTLPELMDLYRSSMELTLSLPTNVNPSLKDLLLSLLKKNPDERIEYEELFNHPFLAEAGDDTDKKVCHPPNPENSARTALTSLGSDLSSSACQVSFYAWHLSEAMGSHPSSDCSSGDPTLESHESNLEDLTSSFECMTLNVAITVSRLKSPDSNTSQFASMLTSMASKFEAISSCLTALAQRVARGDSDRQSVASQIQKVAPQLTVINTDIALALSHPTPEASDLDPIISQLEAVSSMLQLPAPGP